MSTTAIPITRGPRWSTAATLIWALVAALPTLAVAAPPVGGRTSLMGGAGVAQGSDEAAPWLNPAGMAAIPRHTLALSLNAYGLHAIEVSQHFGGPGTAGDGWNDDGYSRTLLLYPASGGVFVELGRPAGEVWHQVVGLSFLTLSTETNDYRAALRRSGLVDLVHDLQWVGDESTYALGAAYALVLPRGFYVGASAFVHWVSGSWSLAGAEDRFDVTTWNQRGGSWTDVGDSLDVGLVANLGLQWHGEYLSAGISARLPRLPLHAAGGGRYELVQVDGVDNNPIGTRIFTDYTFSKIPQDQFLETAIGVAFKLPGRLVVELDGSLYTTFKDRGKRTVSLARIAYQGSQVGSADDSADSWIDYQTTWALALGAELNLGPAVLLAGGFIDNTRRRFPADDDSALLYAFDLYGLSLGAGIGQGRASFYAGAQYTNGRGTFSGSAVDASTGQLSAAPRAARDHRFLVLVSGNVQLGGGAP